MTHRSAPVLLLLLVSVLLVALAEAKLWTYDTGSGCNDDSPCSPSDWSSSWDTCSGSSAHPQSPINFASSMVSLDTVTQGPIAGDYSPCDEWSQFVTPGSVFKIDISDMCDLEMKYKNEAYLLKSISFHSPSEHSVGGGHFEGEVQFKHFNNETKSTFVLSVFLQVSSDSIGGASNLFLDTIWQAAGYDPTNNYVNVSSGLTSLDPYSTLLPSSLAQFHYIGSETVPPCDPVEWFVFEDPVAVSVADMEFLRSMVYLKGEDSLGAYGNNNRPIQPLLSRSVAYMPGGSIPTYAPSAIPTRRPTAGPTRHPTVFIHPGPYKVKVKSAMIVACLALSLTGIVLVAVVVWQIYTAFLQKDWNSYRRLGELETSLPV